MWTMSKGRSPWRGVARRGHEAHVDRVEAVLQPTEVAGHFDLPLLDHDAVDLLAAEYAQSLRLPAFG